MDEYEGDKADLVLSLEVIFHLTEDTLFESYMKRLFDASNKYVLIFCSDIEEKSNYTYIRSRKFSTWISKNAPEWELLEKKISRYYLHEIESGSYFAFHFYKKRPGVT